MFNKLIAIPDHLTEREEKMLALMCAIRSSWDSCRTVPHSERLELLDELAEHTSRLSAFGPLTLSLLQAGYRRTLRINCKHIEIQLPDHQNIARKLYEHDYLALQVPADTPPLDTGHLFEWLWNNTRHFPSGNINPVIPYVTKNIRAADIPTPQKSHRPYRSLKKNPTSIQPLRTCDFIKQSTTLEEIFSIYSAQGKGLDDRGLSTVLYKIASVYPGVSQEFGIEAADRAMATYAPIFHELTRAILNCLPTAKRRPLSIIMVAWAMLRNHDFRVVSAVQDRAVKIIELLHSRDISDIFFSISSLTPPKPFFVEAFISEAVRRMDHPLYNQEFKLLFRPKELIDIIWSLATHDLQPSMKASFIEKALFNLALPIKALPLFTQLRLAWSLMLFEMHSHPFMAGIISSINDHVGVLTDDIQIDFYLTQLDLSFRFEPHRWPSGLSLSSGFLERIHKYVNNRRARRPKPSSAQIVMSEVLTSIGIRSTNEYFFSGFYIDCADTEHQIAFELDGTYSHRRGSDLFRDRILTAQGWRTVRISSKEWNTSKTMHSKADLIRSKLLPVLRSGESIRQ